MSPEFLGRSELDGSALVLLSQSSFLTLLVNLSCMCGIKNCERIVLALMIGIVGAELSELIC